MEHKIRVGNTIAFDDRQEKDIIKAVDDLTDRRQLGKFIEESIRLVYNNPKEVKMLGFPCNTGDVRKQFFDKIDSEVSKIAEKVDKIYEQALIVYIAQKLGSGLALEDRALNIMEATIELERQTKSISDSLGLSAGSRVFARNQLTSTEEQADKVIEFIKDNYSKFVESLSGDLRSRGNVVYVQSEVSTPIPPIKEVTKEMEETIVGNAEIINVVDSSKEKAKAIIEALESDEAPKEAVGFEESADLDAIMAFMGD